MRSGRDVLRQADSRVVLARALADGVDRLVLLGDVLELRQGPVRDALAEAAPVLSELAEALGPAAEVVVVPGNHDHHLLAAWLERRARKDVPPALGLEQPVDWQAEEPLAAVARALAPAGHVRVAYPGVWLREGVYATHGHYADRHTTVPMFERLGAGAMARIVRQPDGGPRAAENYEAILAPIYAWLHALAQVGGPYLGGSSHGASAQAWRTIEGGRDRRRDGGSPTPRRKRPRPRRERVRRRAVIAGFPLAVAALNRAGIGPLRADISGPELRRAALRAIGEVTARLGVEARHVIFGHTHRAGPLPGNEAAEWRAPTGAALTNTGCWVNEPSFLGPRPQESPYRAGFAVRLGDDGPPELVNLLDPV